MVCLCLCTSDLTSMGLSFLIYIFMRLINIHFASLQVFSISNKMVIILQELSLCVYSCAFAHVFGQDKIPSREFDEFKSMYILNFVVYTAKQPLEKVKTIYNFYQGDLCPFLQTYNNEVLKLNYFHLFGYYIVSTPSQNIKGNQMTF